MSLFESHLPRSRSLVPSPNQSISKQRRYYCLLQPLLLHFSPHSICYFFLFSFSCDYSHPTPYTNFLFHYFNGHQGSLLWNPLLNLTAGLCPARIRPPSPLRRLHLQRCPRHRPRFSRQVPYSSSDWSCLQILWFFPGLYSIHILTLMLISIYAFLF